MAIDRAVVGVDLGKTRCRVRIDAGEIVVDRGLPGLGGPGGAESAAARIGGLIERGGPPGTIGAIGIGAAGALSSPGAGRRLAAILSARYGAGVAVASDVVTAHVGAFAGDAGVCLIAGTGAVALAVAGDGRSSLRDGRGLLTGDGGSGAWLGRAGLRAAELAQAGAGPRTRLAEEIPEARGVLDGLVSQADAAARMATHAPAVLSAARAADEVCLDIVDRGIAELSGTAAAAAADVGASRVCAMGGVAADAWFRGRLVDALASGGLEIADARGDALDGAGIMAQRHDLLLEGSIHRA